VAILGAVPDMYPPGRLDAVLAASTVILVGVGFGLTRSPSGTSSRSDRRSDRWWTSVCVPRGVVTRDEVTIIVPNSQLISDQVINHSAPSCNLRITIGVGVAYGTDVERVRELLLGVAASVPQVACHAVAEKEHGDTLGRVDHASLTTSPEAHRALFQRLPAPTGPA
jgi:hypothetical protein